jgi:hypothetical protein
MVSGLVIRDTLKGHGALAMPGSTNPDAYLHIPGEQNELNLSSGDKLHIKPLTSHKINVYAV